jgi:hypothetical protein
MGMPLLLLLLILVAAGPQVLFSSPLLVSFFLSAI